MKQKEALSQIKELWLKTNNTEELLQLYREGKELYPREWAQFISRQLESNRPEKALKTVASCGDTQFLPLLKQLPYQIGGKKLHLVIEAIAQLGGISILIELYDDPFLSFQHKSLIAKLLSKAEFSEELEEFFIRQLNSPYLSIKKEAISFLEKSRSSKGFSALAKLLLRFRRTSLFSEICRAIIHISPSRAREILLLLFSTQEKQVKLQIVKALSQYPSPSSLEILQTFSEIISKEGDPHRDAELSAAIRDGIKKIESFLEERERELSLSSQHNLEDALFK